MKGGVLTLVFCDFLWVSSDLKTSIKDFFLVAECVFYMDGRTTTSADG